MRLWQNNNSGIVNGFGYHGVPITVQIIMYLACILNSHYKDRIYTKIENVNAKESLAYAFNNSKTIIALVRENNGCDDITSSSMAQKISSKVSFSIYNLIKC